MPEIASDTNDATTLIRIAPGERTGACAIAIMAKASIAGVCKTRLIGPLSAQDAARLNTAFLKDMVANIAEAGEQDRIHPYLAVAPAGSARLFADAFPTEVGLLEVAHPDFGLCLLRTIQRLLSLGYESACVLNSDSPTLPTSLLAGAARRLSAGGDRGVLGPSDDGGYYLLGLKAAHARLFQDISWSTQWVADQTRERADEIGLRLHELPPWYDVDDAETLARLRREVSGAACSMIDAYAAPHTSALLARLPDLGVPA